MSRRLTLSPRWPCGPVAAPDTWAFISVSWNISQAPGGPAGGGRGFSLETPLNSHKDPVWTVGLAVPSRVWREELPSEACARASPAAPSAERTGPGEIT